MRRIKFKLGIFYIKEKKAIIESQNRLFEEHSIFTDEDILIDYEA